MREARSSKLTGMVYRESVQTITTMSYSPSVFDELFDNKEWAEKNLRGTFDPKDVDRVFDYVLRVHPHFGCTTTKFAKWDAFLRANQRTISIDDAARLADAVVVFSFEALGNDPDQAKALKKGIAEGVGSIFSAMSTPAFIAINHSDPSVRDQFKGLFELARNMDRGGL